MATKKNPPAPATNGHPAPPVNGYPENPNTEPKPRRETKAQREQRIQAIQENAARLRAMAEEVQGPQEWHKLIGSHADDPDLFEEAMRLGREWRESFRPKPRRRKSKAEDGHS